MARWYVVADRVSMTRDRYWHFGLKELGSELMLCQIGHAYEEATGWYKKHPNV